jgi:hypothetical protein
MVRPVAAAVLYCAVRRLGVWPVSDSSFGGFLEHAGGGPGVVPHSRTTVQCLMQTNSSVQIARDDQERCQTAAALVGLSFSQSLTRVGDPRCRAPFAGFGGVSRNGTEFNLILD